MTTFNSTETKKQLLTNLAKIKLELLEKMERANYSRKSRDNLNHYCAANLDLYNNDLEMKDNGANVLNSFFFSSELTTLFKNYCATEQKLNELLIHDKYTTSLEELKNLVIKKKLTLGSTTAHSKMLILMEDLYEAITKEAEKGPHVQKLMIDLITSLKDNVNLENNHKTHQYIRAMPLELCAPLAQMIGVTVALSIVTGLNPATVMGVVAICALALMAVLISSVIYLSFSLRNQDLSQRLVAFCAAYNHAESEHLKNNINPLETSGFFKPRYDKKEENTTLELLEPANYANVHQ